MKSRRAATSLPISACSWTSSPDPEFAPKDFHAAGHRDG
jgi:hypothetical protein